MNVFDYIIFLPIALGFVIGLFKGFVKELASFLAVFVAYLAAEMFSGQAQILLSAIFNFSVSTGKTVAYVFVFIVAILLTFLASKMIGKLLSSINLGWLNSLAGGVLSALKYAMIISILMNIFDAVDLRFHFVKQEKKEASIGYVPILKLAPALWKQSKEFYNEQQHQKNDSIEKDDSIENSKGQ